MTVLSALSLCTLTSCDDGRIYDSTSAGPEGKVVKLQAELSGLENWPEKYDLALAGFDDEDEYAIISKVISSTEDDGSVTMVMAGIDDEVTNVKLCVLDQLRRLVVSFGEADVTTARDTVYMNLGTVDASMFNAIQQNVFNTTCANCHGASNTAAAGLYLTEGKSYQALVGQASAKIDGKKIVEPGDAENSVLHMALSTDSSATWRYNHQSEVTNSRTLTLIDNWINNGAKEN